MLRGGEVDELRPVRAAHPSRLGEHVTVNAETRDAAVGEDREPEMREALGGAHLEAILRIALQVGALQDLRPFDLVPEEIRDIGIARDRRALEHARLRIIAFEVRRVDDDTTDDPGEAESNDADVVLAVLDGRLRVASLAS